MYTSILLCMCIDNVQVLSLLEATIKSSGKSHLIPKILVFRADFKHCVLLWYCSFIVVPMFFLFLTHYLKNLV